MPYEPPRSKGRAIGSFFTYFGIWLAAQVVVTVAFFIPIAFSVLTDKNVRAMGYDFITDYLKNEVLRHVNLISILSSVLFLVAVTVIFTVRQNRRDKLGVVPKKNLFAEVGFVKAPACVCVISAGLGVVLNRIVTYIVDFVPWPRFFVSSFDDTYGQVFGKDQSIVIVAVSTVVIAPITEEIVFRGIACSRLRSVFPHVVTVIASALIFGVSHGVPIAVIYASALGVVQACVFLRHGSLYPVMLCLFICGLIVLCFQDIDNQEMVVGVLVYTCIIAVVTQIMAICYFRFYFPEIILPETDLKDGIIGMFSVSLVLLLFGFVLTPLFYNAFVDPERAELRAAKKSLKKMKEGSGDYKKTTDKITSLEKTVKEKAPVFGFGMGDVILMAAGGLMLGTKAVVTAFFIAVILGGFYGIYKKIVSEDGDNAFAFGPFLILGLVVTAFTNGDIINLYLETMIYRR